MAFYARKSARQLHKEHIWQVKDDKGQHYHERDCPICLDAFFAILDMVNEEWGTCPEEGTWQPKRGMPLTQANWSLVQIAVVHKVQERQRLFDHEDDEMHELCVEENAVVVSDLGFHAAGENEKE